ncbi:MAG TPA: caspase family protein [Caldilineaceae bacterium]|nr:caspase family protein [Caldilineaceae bacterium]
MMQQTLYALLVGINHYASPTVPDLGGCVNDVNAMATILQHHFAVAPANIKTLVNEQATYDAVKLEFRQHLLESVRKFMAGVGADRRELAPAVLFHFSGHGSQAPDPTGQEPDGFDETLVCHDSRLPNVYDLKDWELGQLLDELAAYTENITVILDCCHAGSGTRSETKVLSHTRSCFPDLRPQPRQRSQEFSGSMPLMAERSAPSRRSGHNAAVAPRHWRQNQANHVLLAACRDQERALEYIPPPGETITDPRQAQRHGVLTYYLMPLLEKLDVRQPPTYRELYEELHQVVTQRYPQTPQCEGDWGRLVFGRARPDRELWLTVVDQRDGLYWVNGGLVHGIGVGACFDVYQPGARTVTDAGAPLGMLEAVTVDAVQCGCTVVSHSVPIPRQARLMLRATGKTERKALALVIPHAKTAAALRERLAQDDLAGLVVLTPVASDAALRIALVDQALEIQQPDGERIGDAYPLRTLNRMRRPLRAADLDPVASDLRRIVRAQHLDLLQNVNSDHADAIALTVRALEMDPMTGQAVAGAVIGKGYPATRSDANATRPTLREGTPFVIEISNQAEEPLYVGLLLRSGAWSVEQIYPEMRGAQEQLFPGRTLLLGLAAEPERQLCLALAGDARVEEVTFLLIGTVEATDFTPLLQQERRAAAKSQAQQTVGQNDQRLRRSFQMGGPADAADAWLALRLTVRVVAA